MTYHMIFGIERCRQASPHTLGRAHYGTCDIASRYTYCRPYILTCRRAGMIRARISVPLGVGAAAQKPRQ